MAERDQVCSKFHRAIELIGKKWTGAIIQTLLGGPHRFTELLAAVPGLHDRLLSERLKELEQEDMVKRAVYPETPVRIEYELTPRGRDLEKVVAEVQRWAERWTPARTPAGRAR